MGYRVLYVYEGKKRSSRRRVLLTWGFFAVFLALLLRFCPELLLPGGESAVESFCRELRIGAPVGEAVAAFCRQVVP